MSFFKTLVRLFTLPRYRIFISYSRKHEDVASGFYRLLVPNSKAFLDTVSIGLGETWQEKLDSEVRSCTHLYVLWCSHAHESPNVKAEIDAAIKTRKSIVPICISDHPLSEELSPYQGVVQSFTRICLSTSSQVEGLIQNLAERSERDLERQWRSEASRVRLNRAAAATVLFMVPAVPIALLQLRTEAIVATLPGGPPTSGASVQPVSQSSSQSQLAAAMEQARMSAEAESLGREGDERLARNELSQALNVFRRALAIHERLATAQQVSAQRQADVATTLARIAAVQREQDNLPAALASHRASANIFEGLAKSDPGNLGWIRNLASQWGHIGDIRLQQGDAASALQNYLPMLDITQRLYEAEPDSHSFRRAFARALERIGSARFGLGELAAASVALEDSITIGRLLSAYNSSDPVLVVELSRTLTVLANVRNEQRQHDSAALLYREAAALADKAVALELSTPSMLGRHYTRLGEILAAQRNHEEALKAFLIAAKWGDSVAERRLGVAYAEGLGTPLDYVEALKWLARAAEAGDGVAMLRLGTLSANGQGVAKNERLASDWFRKAASSQADQPTRDAAADAILRLFATSTVPSFPIYIVLRDSPVRQRPRDDAMAIEELSHGSLVEVAGGIGSWAIVARNGRPVGFARSEELVPRL